MQRASGGEAWAWVKTLHLVVAATSEGSTVRREHWEDVATGRYLETADRPAGEARLGFEGITAWLQPSGGVGYAFGDLDSALTAADQSFRVARAWWFRDRHPATIALVGTQAEAGRWFDVLAITPEGGRAFEAWIDRSTHLLARTDEQQAEERVAVAPATDIDAARSDELAVVDEGAPVLGLVSDTYVRRRYAEEVDKAQRSLFGEA